MSDRPPTVQNFAIVPEDIIIACANQIADEEFNNFDEALAKAQVFRRAGMNPVYLSTPNLKNLLVTSYERMENKFH
jgi:hypothetical protein